MLYIFMIKKFDYKYRKKYILFIPNTCEINLYIYIAEPYIYTTRVVYIFEYYMRVGYDRFIGRYPLKHTYRLSFKLKIFIENFYSFQT
jgi:hypothetical protein